MYFWWGPPKLTGPWRHTSKWISLLHVSYSKVGNSVAFESAPKNDVVGCLLEADSDMPATGLLTDFTLLLSQKPKWVPLQSFFWASPRCNWGSKRQGKEEGCRCWLWLGWPRRCSPPLQPGLSFYLSIFVEECENHSLLNPRIRYNI